MYTPLLFDRPRRLRFDIQACLDLEAALNMPFGEIVMRLNQLSITAICAALWAGLKHDDPTLTLSLIRKMLQSFLDDGGRLKTINDALNLAISDSTPLKSGAEETEGNVPPQPVAIG